VDEPSGAVIDSTPVKEIRISTHARQVLGYVFAGVCLVWVFHDIRPGEFLAHLKDIDPRWVMLAVVCDVVSYVIQGLRWQLLLRPINRISLVRAIQAIYVGLFANEVLPLRFGELVRGYMAARWLSSRFVSVIPSMAIERLFDGIWLAVGIGLTAIFVPLPHELQKAADALGLIILFAAGLFLHAVFRRQAEPLETTGRKRSWWHFLEPVLLGLRAAGRTRGFYLAFILSLAFLGTQALSFWLVMWAYGMRLSFWIGLVVLLILHLGTAIPNAPANVGSYQFFVVAGLSLFGVEKTYAAGFSAMVFIVLTIPLWVVGFLALSGSGTTLKAIQKDLRQWTKVEGTSE
jgi:glycosyltransferase 2 family protein